MSLWQHYIKVFLSGVSKIIRGLYLNVFRNISTLKISKNHLLGELYVRVLSVKVFVKIGDSLFMYGGECVVNVT